jgi:hypothetical protein
MWRYKPRSVPLHYHVIVSFDGTENKTVLMKDLTEREVRKKFVKPYKKGIDILCGNEILSLKNLKFVQIAKTSGLMDFILDKEIDKAHQEEQDFNDNNAVIVIGSSLHINDYNIANYGEDVTASFISEASGSGTIIQKIIQGFNRELTAA